MFKRTVSQVYKTVNKIVYVKIHLFDASNYIFETPAVSINKMMKE